MKILAWTLGIVGACCFIMGIVLSSEEVTIDALPNTYTPMFWLVIAVVLLVGAIAAAIGISKEQ